MMLEKIDLSKKIKKKEYNEMITPAKLTLARLQREARDKELPVIIVFEGWDASGKGTLINHLILPMDPRGYQVYTIHDPTEEERLRPFLWRFWIKLPERGRMAIFDRSWYKRTLEDRVDGLLNSDELQLNYQDINFFERQLTYEGYIIIKFFIHIDKKEQKKRLRRLARNKLTSWRVTKKDKKHHKQYLEYLQATEEMIEATDTANASWTIIEGHDQRFAVIKVIQKVIQTIEERLLHLEKINQGDILQDEEKETNSPNSMYQSKLDKINLQQEIDTQSYKKNLDKYKTKLRKIQYQIYLERIPVIILYEGWDAAGKGGNIRRLVSNLDPRGYEVVPICAPNAVEKRHHFLWRFWQNFPKAGHITIFDRSWYGRVLVERVEKLTPEKAWKRAYREINEMEKHFVHFGGILLKFWLQIDQEEQFRRFKARENDPEKKWKITPEDWRNREKWDEYQRAIDDMLFKTSTYYAPWTIVESNNKRFARIKVLKEVYQKIEKKIKMIR